MTTSGILKVSSGISELNGTRLARQGANPFTAATNFLANRGFGNNSPITVDGTDDFVGGVPVIFINSVEAGATRDVARRGARKAAKKPAARKAAGKKRAAKKIRRKGAKKSAAKKSRKSARKR